MHESFMFNYFLQYPFLIGITVKWSEEAEKTRDYPDRPGRSAVAFGVTGARLRWLAGSWEMDAGDNSLARPATKPNPRCLLQVSQNIVCLTERHFKLQLIQALLDLLFTEVRRFLVSRWLCLTTLQVPDPARCVSSLLSSFYHFSLPVLFILRPILLPFIISLKDAIVIVNQCIDCLKK